jgi:hypothetical protein
MANYFVIFELLGHSQSHRGEFQPSFPGGSTMRIEAALLSLAALTLTGCGAGLTVTRSGSSPQTSSFNVPAIHGRVHGGQGPVANANVYLLAANNTGWGQPSLSLINNVPGTTFLDTSGTATNGFYYVKTDSNGDFNLNGDPIYNCNILLGSTSPGEVYISAVGGNSGSGINPALSLMAPLGKCPASGNFASDAIVVVNEVTTVGAAVALNNFFLSPTALSAPNDTANQTALANAFNWASVLVNVSTGTANATTPDGTGILPQATINLIANILSSCVNSNGSMTSGSNCSTLFLNANSKTASPTDTATAALNMAYWPGENVAQLYGLASAQPVFPTTIISQPHDFSMAAYYSLSVAGPLALAYDGNGFLWAADKGDSKILEWSPSTFSFATLPSGNGVNLPTAIAVNGANDVFVANSNGSLSGFLNNGTAMTGSPFTGGGLGTPIAMTIDSQSNVWVLNNNNTASEFSSSGSPLSPSGGWPFVPGPFVPSTVGQISGIAATTAGHIYAMDATNNVTYVFNPNASEFQSDFGASQPFYGVILDPIGLTSDASGDIWYVNGGADSVVSMSDSSTDPYPYTVAEESAYGLQTPGASVAENGPVAAALTAEGATVQSAYAVVADANTTTPCVEVPQKGNPLLPSNSGQTNFKQACPSGLPAQGSAPKSSATDGEGQFAVTEEGQGEDIFNTLLFYFSTGINAY